MDASAEPIYAIGDRIEWDLQEPYEPAPGTIGEICDIAPYGQTVYDYRIRWFPHYPQEHGYFESWYIEKYLIEFSRPYFQDAELTDWFELKD